MNDGCSCDIALPTAICRILSSICPEATRYSMYKASDIKSKTLMTPIDSSRWWWWWYVTSCLEKGPPTETLQISRGSTPLPTPSWVYQTDSMVCFVYFYCQLKYNCSLHLIRLMMNKIIYYCSRPKSNTTTLGSNVFSHSNQTWHADLT